MQIPHELSAFLSPESSPGHHKRQVSGIGNTFYDNRTRMPFIIAFAIGLPIILGIACVIWWYRVKGRRAYFAGDRQPPARGNQTWGKKRTGNVRASSGPGFRGGNGVGVQAPPPVYTSTTPANTSKNLPTDRNLPDPVPQAGESSGSSAAPPSYADATVAEAGQARI